MFDPTSRYYAIEEGTLTVRDADGTERHVAYKRRRFVPQPGEATPLAEHGVVEGDRLDNITARYLGDPAHFWRLADANMVISPLELTEEPGARITIPLPTQ